MMKLTIALFLTLVISGCGYKIVKPECNQENPEDCVYLLKVRGAIPWKIDEQ